MVGADRQCSDAMISYGNVNPFVNRLEYDKSMKPKHVWGRRDQPKAYWSLSGSNQKRTGPYRGPTKSVLVLIGVQPKAYWSLSGSNQKRTGPYRGPKIADIGGAYVFLNS